MDVLPLPPTTAAESTTAATCAGCGAPLAADQRYCLGCGQPCSPVRLAFLDVLQSEHAAAPPAVLGAPLLGYAPPPEPPGTLAALRRYSGLFGLLGVLLASLLIGLLVGHWLSGGGSSPAKQVIEVKGLPAFAAAPAGATGSSAGTSTGSSGTGSPSGGHSSAGSGSSRGHTAAASEGGVQESAAEEAQAAKEVKSTKALPPAHQLSLKTAHTTGKQHAKEVREQGAAPLETH